MAILTSDYNALQARISKILGVGENEFGYGQTVTSFYLANTVPALTPDFTRLRADILAARYHQIGVPATPPISVISTQITAAQWTQFLTVTTQVEISKLVSPNVTQATRIELVNEVTPENTWNNTTTHTLTVQFDDAEHMRYYFNTGSAIEFSASHVNNATNSKSVAWNSLLTGIGVVNFEQAATTSTKTSGSVIGFNALTTEDQIIFKKTKVDTPAANVYQIEARQEVYEETGEPTGVLIFTIKYINTGANVTGKIYSIVNVYHASGSYVAIDPPAIISEFDAGVSNPTFALSRTVATVNETSINVDFTVTTTNFLDGLLYFSISGTSISTGDFSPDSDLVLGTLRGTVEILNNSGTFTLIPAADLFTEGKEQFQVQLRIDENLKSPVLAQLSSLEIITDTSLTPPTPTYKIMPLSTTSVSEGQTILYRIFTTNVKNGSDLYWSTKVLTPSLLSSDFLDNRLNGVLTVYGNYTELYRTIYEDTINETTSESYQIVLSEVNVTTGIPKTVQTSEVVRITDKISIEPIIPYVVLVDDNSIPEDSTTKITFTIKTPKLPTNTKLYWKTVKDSGVLAAADFTDNTLTGTVVINSNNVGIVTRKAKKDALTEGNETFHLSVFSDVGMTNWLVDSDPVTIEETISYSLIRTPATMEESTTSGALGAGVTFNLTTPWLPNGTVLYWTTVSEQGVVEAADFTDNAIDGFVTITENYKGVILRRAAKDSLVEGTEQFHLEIRATVGTIDPILVSSQLTSITETVAYEIIPLTSYMVEDQPGIEFNVKTPFLKEGTLLYWDTISVTGAVTASDFTDNRLSGTVEINGNVGSFTRTAILDSLTEGKESFQIILKTGSSISTKVATSSVVTIGETVAYTIALTSPTFTEGLAPITVSITTPAVLDDTKIYWTILKHAGNITTDDFIVSDAQGGAGQRLDGFVLTKKNKASFIISARRDLITEEPETFNIELRTDSILGGVQATSALITLNEIIPYTIVPAGLTVVNEGDTVQFNVTTPWISDQEKRQLNWTTYSTLGTINTSDHPDFTDSITGSVIVKGNSAQIFRTINKDTFTELGVKNFGLKLWDTNGTLLATSTVVTMVDTSQTIVVPEPEPPTYSVVPRISKIVEGGSVIFDVFTDNVLPATPLYWSTIRSNNCELLQTQSSSPVYITYDNPGTSNLGRTTITVTASTNNNRIDADRMFLLVLRTGSVNGTEVATSSMPVAVVDATPYLIKANNSSITEGSPTGVRFDISTPDASFGTTMTYTIVPEPGSDITFEDFVGLSSLTNPVTIDQYGAGNFTLRAAANAPKELDESFHIELRPQNSQTPVTLGAPSPIVRITETAVYSLVSTTAGNSVMEGSAATFTFSTPKLPTDIMYSYTIVGVGANGGSISGSDFSPAGLTGNFTVTSALSSYSLSILTTAGSSNPEGSEQFQLEITSGGSPVVLSGNSPIITITENTPYTITPLVSSPVKEGDNISFRITSPMLPLNTQLLCMIKPTNTSGAGSFTAQDIDKNTFSLNVTLTDGYRGTLDFVAKDDGTTKGDRPFTVWLYDKDTINYVSSSTVVITDRAATTTGTGTVTLTPGTVAWTLNTDKKIIIQGQLISYTLATSAASTSDQTISWTISIVRQEIPNLTSNPFSQTTGSFLFPANTGKVVFTVPTIASPGIVIAKVALTLNGNTLAFTDVSGFNNTGVYPTVAFSGYAAEVMVVENKPISLSLNKNQLVKGIQDSIEVTITAPWYLGMYNGISNQFVRVFIKVDSAWSAYDGGTPNPNAHFLPVYQNVTVTGIAPGMTIDKQYMDATGKCTFKLNDNPKNAVANSAPLNLEGHTFYVGAYDWPEAIGNQAIQQPFTVVAKPSYSITTDKGLINETTDRTVRFTVTTPASATSVTTLYWKLIGVDPKVLGLTSDTGSKTKDVSNSTWFEFTAVTDNTDNNSKREFYIEVRSTPTGTPIAFDIACPKVVISDTSGAIKHAITITGYRNETSAITGITMPLATQSVGNWDKTTQYLSITANVSPAFTNEKFTCTIIDFGSKSLPDAITDIVLGTTAFNEFTQTSDSSSNLKFEFKSRYRASITESTTFRFKITSVSEPTCTITTTALYFTVPNTPPPPPVFKPAMSISPSPVSYAASASLTISGGKPLTTGVIKLTAGGPLLETTGAEYTPGKSITLTNLGQYTVSLPKWTTGGTANFTASFADNTSCTAAVTVTPPLVLTITGEMGIYDTTYRAGVSTKDYGTATCKFLNATRTDTITISIHSTDTAVQLIRQAFNANVLTGVLPGTYTTTSITTSNIYTVIPQLTARQITGLPLSSTFTVRFTSTYLNGSVPVVVESGNITLIGQAVYTNTLTLAPAPLGTKYVSLTINVTGNPGTNVVISCEGIVVVKTNTSVGNIKLDLLGKGSISYNVANNSHIHSASPFYTMSLGAKGKIKATFSDNASLSQEFVITGKYGVSSGSPVSVTVPQGTVVTAAAVGAGGGGGASIEANSWNGTSGGGGGAGGTSRVQFISDGLPITLVSGKGGLGGIDTITTEIAKKLCVTIPPTDGGNSTITYNGGTTLTAFGGKAGGRGIAWMSTEQPVPAGGAGGNGTSNYGEYGESGVVDKNLKPPSGASTNRGSKGGVNVYTEGYGSGGDSPTISEGGDQKGWSKKPGISGVNGVAIISWIDLSVPAVTSSDPGPAAPQTTPSGSSLTPELPPSFTTATYNIYSPNASGLGKYWAYTSLVGTTYDPRMYWENLNIPVVSGMTITSLGYEQLGTFTLYNSTGSTFQVPGQVATPTWPIPPNFGTIVKIEIYRKNWGFATGYISNLGGAVLWSTTSPADHFSTTVTITPVQPVINYVNYVQYTPTASGIGKYWVYPKVPWDAEPYGSSYWENLNITITTGMVMKGVGINNTLTSFLLTNSTGATTTISANNQDQQLNVSFGTIVRIQVIQKWGFVAGTITAGGVLHWSTLDTAQHKG
jgi:hypothetical protein